MKLQWAKVGDNVYCRLVAEAGDKVSVSDMEAIYGRTFPLCLKPNRDEEGNITREAINEKNMVKVQLSAIIAEIAIQGNSGSEVL
jgi:hypothetical protein